MRLTWAWLLVIAVTLFIGCSSETKSLVVTPKAVDFGSIYIGDKSEIELELKNKYSRDMIISSVSLSGSSDYIIVSGGTAPISIPKNATAIVKIKFEPTSAGVLDGLLTIVHDQSSKPKDVEITGVGVKIARISFPVTNYDYGKVLYNTQVTHDFELANVGTDILTISSFNFTGAAAPLFTVTAGGSVPVNITPGSKHTFTVQFAPVALGNFQANLEVFHNAVNETSPMSVTLTGIGVDLDPRITLSVSSPWDFGLTATTIPGVQICEIENTGTDPLTVSSATLTTGAEFAVDSLMDSNGNPISFPQILGIGAKIFLAIKFAPTAKTTYYDTLTFVHDGTNESSPWDITLTGEGRDEIVKSFTYTGSAQQWTVPAGVTTILVAAYGAEGGNSTGSNGIAGKGGKVEATLMVTPGDTLNIYVGGKGGNGTAGVGGTGGWNGGAAGEGWSGSRGGGGGGGATDIRRNGTALADRTIVAGAGGGGGHNSSGEAGGNGGGLVGQIGATKYGGGGGTQSAGGAGGDAGSGRIATPGSLGTGGGAWTASTGGGGGAGYYGGGGGSFEAGGGGSSYTETSASNVVHNQGANSGDGSLTITY